MMPPQTIPIPILGKFEEKSSFVAPMCDLPRQMQSLFNRACRMYPGMKCRFALAIRFGEKQPF